MRSTHGRPISVSDRDGLSSGLRHWPVGDQRSGNAYKADGVSENRRTDRVSPLPF
jgi:hypothetical protein